MYSVDLNKFAVCFLFGTCLLQFHLVLAVVDRQECSNASLFPIGAFAKIYDNQTRGDIIYSYLDIFNESLQLEEHCNGLEVKGSDIILTMTKTQLNDKCDVPAGECHVRCGQTIKGSLFRSRAHVDQEGPVFSKASYEFSIPETIIIGTNVFDFEDERIVRKDCYFPDAKTFTIQTIVGRPAFVITYPSKILLNRSLDYENGDRNFVLHITLNNKGRFATTTVKVTVMDVDDMDPEFDHDTYVISVRENENRSSVWRKTEPEIEAHDRDTGTGKQDILFARYDDNDRDLYDINNITGQIKILKILDREQTSRYNLRVKVYQKNDPNRSGTANLIIHVIDENDNPPSFDQSEYTASVDEHSSTGTFLCQVHATDKDEGNYSRIIYSISNSQDLFSIDENTGVISVKNQDKLDADNTTSPYILQRSRGVAICQRTATLNPRSDLSRFQVITKQRNLEDQSQMSERRQSKADILEKLNIKNEMIRIGTDIIKDMRTRGVAICQRTATLNPRSDLSRFQVWLFSMFLFKKPFEVQARRKNNYTRTRGVAICQKTATLNPRSELSRFQVLATDVNKSSYTDTAVVRVTIRDRNDNSPIFSKTFYNFNVTGSGIFGKITANDLDHGKNGAIEYTLEMEPQGVKINKSTGELSSTGQLTDTATFRVKACDSPIISSGRRCSYADIQISANSVSKLPNSNMTLDVVENLPVGSIVTVMQVLGSAYRIIEKDTPFTISSRGVVTVASTLDYESGRTKYNFDINVLDKVQTILSTVHMTINILDANDNAPQFLNNSYVFSMPDDISKVIGQVKAVDKDSGINGHVTYTLQSNMDSSLFSCDPNTGDITMNQDGGAHSYHLYIKASDGGIPTMSSFAEVLITRVGTIGGKVKFGTPLEKIDLIEKKEDLERKIGNILDIQCTIESSTGVSDMHSYTDTRSFILMTGHYKNGTTVYAQALRISLLEHMAEIQQLFGRNSTSYISRDQPTGLTVPEIVLIALGGVIFIGSIILIVILRSQWQKYYVKQFQFDRLNNNLTRKSSLYESQEIKVKMDDETSDYAGSLHTQDVENSTSGKISTLDAAAFSNPVYQTVHGQTLVISPSTAVATNEALESLQDLADRLNVEERAADENGVCSDEQTYVKEADGTKIITSVETYEDVDFSAYSNFEIEPRKTDNDVDSTNLMKFESDPALHPALHNAVNLGDEMFENEPEEAEPDVDYNDKQVRFASNVLDTEDDVFKPLKQESFPSDRFLYDSDQEDKGMDTMVSSFPDLYRLMKHDSDETDRADEEINSPIDFLKVDSMEHLPTVNDNFQFGIAPIVEDEITKF